MSHACTSYRPLVRLPARWWFAGVALTLWAPAVSVANEPAADELVAAVRLPAALRFARRHNPEIGVATARAEAAVMRANADGRLPEPELRYEQWAVPLSHPTALDRADALILTVMQTLPAWGVRDARLRAGQARSGSAHEAARVQDEQLALAVTRAFAAYWRAQSERELRRDLVVATERAAAVGRAGHAATGMTLPEVLQLELDTTRAQLELARSDGELAASRVRLNVALGRDAAAPLGPAEPPDLRDQLTVHEGSAARPSVQQAAYRLAESAAMAEERRWAALVPSVALGLGYWYLPTAPAPHAYGAMVTVNLPWLAPARGDERREAERLLRADQHALAAARAAARAEREEAVARVTSAERVLALVEQQLLPTARRGLEAAQRALAAGATDAASALQAERAVLEAQMDRVRARADLIVARGELAAATGQENTP